MLIIRTATVTDAEPLRTLSRETFYKKWLSTNTEKDLQTYMDEFFSLEKIQEELNDTDVTYLLAQSEKQLIGYCKINRNKTEGELNARRPIEVQRMYVLEEFIGNGIGKQLMHKALEIARAEKFDTVWLGVWENNIPAVNFYKSFGFDFYGAHDFVLGEDITTDLLMKKVL